MNSSTGLRSPQDVSIDRMKYLMAVGCSDLSGAIAKKLAHDIYDEQLGRSICSHTGNIYFSPEMD